MIKTTITDALGACPPNHAGSPTWAVEQPCVQKHVPSDSRSALNHDNGSQETRAKIKQDKNTNTSNLSHSKGRADGQRDGHPMQVCYAGNMMCHRWQLLFPALSGRACLASSLHMRGTSEGRLYPDRVRG